MENRNLKFNYLGNYDSVLSYKYSKKWGRNLTLKDDEYNFKGQRTKVK